MNIPLTQVSEENRIDFFKKQYKPKQCIYMGDGIHDAPIFSLVHYGIAPNNAVPTTKRKADFVTKANSAEGAVLEACLHVQKKFFHIRAK